VDDFYIDFFLFFLTGLISRKLIKQQMSAQGLFVNLIIYIALVSTCKFLLKLMDQLVSLDDAIIIITTYPMFATVLLFVLLIEAYQMVIWIFRKVKDNTNGV
jgi:hypothetical protein